MTSKEDIFFHAGELLAQNRYGDPLMWDGKRRERLLWHEIPLQFHARLESAPFFFLATSDDRGHCDCSFKGGGEGLIKVISSKKMAFPDFDGNGAFMSIGNILVNPHVGMLFVDFRDGARLRINGRASVHEKGEMAFLFAGSRRAVVVDIEQVVPNCAKHIPHMVFAKETLCQEKAG
ncbi:MAG: pyridoxamine 5'-phosphate oxidase family protein [Micavibrio aeruginosavorus]|uniref:Pyridoxamine 5'-phosphate oxidase family protein n=1 Tax=Micavibrio aeruginosavorus TaxID=349221 RepID=A0A7T5UFW0_9BACT|nr:MAG: pyridoxamine 5'-phosphate oxidase family protein [Micavibrio aeruginosavorus]